jgi:hypothetical protein
MKGLADVLLLLDMALPPEMPAARSRRAGAIFKLE